MPKKCLTLMAARMEQLPLIRNLYWKLLDSSEEYAGILQWKKGIYPADVDWIGYIQNGEIFLLWDAGALIGAVALTETQPYAYREGSWSCPASEGGVLVIHLLAIHPDHQGQGYDRAALDAIAAFAREKGKQAMRLDAIATNKPAQRLYEAYGFQSCRTRRLYYESTGLTDFLFYDYPLK